MLFPNVKKLCQTGVFNAKDECCLCLADISGLSPETVFTVFGDLPSEGNIMLYCRKDEALSDMSPEAYSIKAENENGTVTVNVNAPSDRALIRGLFTLKRMLLTGEIVLGEITDYPSFSVRGYIEGFYGKPWKNSERLEMLETMALFGENTHYYAPKDDPYHRALWKECYPPEEADGLLALVKKAQSLYMDFYYCIAPGLSMCYSSEKDIEALFAKTRQLFSMGIKNFGLLLDDIPADLYYEEDKLRFRNARNAHVFLVGKYCEFLESLSSECRLTVCPTAYHGKGTEKELTDFAGNIPEKVNVFYTGSDICSKEITCREAQVFFENTGHRPLYWDNYPVNDAEMFMEMHIGPVIGREEELYRYSEGIISNCMEYFNCNKLPLITVAAYLWAPESYNPEEAFEKAVEYCIRESEREAFIQLFDQFRTSCLKDENSRIMGEYLSAASVCFNTGEREKALDILTRYEEIISRAAKTLKSGTSPLHTELERWLKKFYLMSEILTLSVKVIKGESDKGRLAEMMEAYNESATVLTSFCFREYIESVLGYDY